MYKDREKERERDRETERGTRQRQGGTEIERQREGQIERQKKSGFLELDLMELGSKGDTSSLSF